MNFVQAADPNDIDDATRLVWQYGFNTTVFQILNKGIERAFGDDGESLIGFVRHHHVRVVAGAPVCAKDRVGLVMAAWEADARSQGETVCYFGAETRVQSVAAERPGYSQVVLGAQPVWTPQDWISNVRGSKSLRAQLNRAKNKGVTVEEWSREKAENNPDLWRILGEWLTTRGLPSLHFMVEPETLYNLTGRRLFVALQNGVPVGFVNLAPVPRRNGYLTEQFVRGHQAPNGTIELILQTAVEAIAENGAEFLTMGIVPLSLHDAGAANFANPQWLNIILAWVRAHGRRFYNFDGLDEFKSKFQPSYWEAIYAVSNEPRFSFRSLYAIAEAFCQTSPVFAVGVGIGKAILQEAEWLRRKVAPIRARSR